MSTDIVSDVLRAVRLTGAIFFDVRARAPWAAEAPPADELAPLVIPGAQRVLEYHVITQGTCFARVLDASDEPVQLEAGSVIVFPQGHPHVLSSAPRMTAPRPDLTVYHNPSGRLPIPLVVEERSHDRSERTSTHMICGFLGFDARPFNPLIAALPKLLHVAGGYTGDGWLGNLIDATVKESQQPRLGSSGMLPRLSELIFVEVVRRYMESLPADALGWLTALRDPQLGRALALMHGEPKHAWNLALLAKAAGVSRTVLVERFSSHVGMAPMAYLLNWRMQLAAGMLVSGAANIARIASEVGYESEAAFSRAFKRITGASPAAWRAETTREIQRPAYSSERLSAHPSQSSAL